jgi:lipoprotein-anchoring transpeptidase ErfK/SrfK
VRRVYTSVVRRGLVAALFVLGFGLAGGFSATVVAAVTGTTATGTGTTGTVTTATTATTATTSTTPTIPEPEAIASGVTIASVAVGDLTSEEAYAAVQRRFERRLWLAVPHGRLSPTPEQFGAVARIKGAVRRALVAEPGEHVPLVVTFRSARVRTYVAAAAKRFDRLPVDSTLSLRSNRPYVSPDVPGRTLLRKKAVAAIVRQLAVTSRARVALRFEAVPAAVTRADFGPVIVIQRGANHLNLYDGMRLVRSFGVATGQRVYPTPLGRFSIVVKWRDPWWYPPASPWAKGAKPVPPGPGNPLGTRWMGLSSPGVGIHGTPDDGSIGYSVSHGCIRMHISDAEWLFNQVDVGTTVFIVSA